ncbi:hypothetical protein J3U16_12060, partial [Gilliamella sp. B3023]
QGIDNALSVLKQKIDNPTPKCEDNEQGLRIEQLFTENFAYYALVSFVICFILAKLLYRKDKTKQCLRTGLFNALSVAGYTLWHVEYILEIAFLMFIIMCVVFGLSTMASGILTPGAGGGGNSRGGSDDFGDSSGGFSDSGGFSGGGGGHSGGGGASGRW